MRRDREFEPGDRVRVAASGRATHGRVGTVVAPDESWPFGPCVILDGDREPGAYDRGEIEPLGHEPRLDVAQASSPGPPPVQDGDRLARAIAKLILEDRARLTAEWQARIDAADAKEAAARGLDRASLAAVLACAEEYIAGAPLNRALVLHALRAALVQLGERPGWPRVEADGPPGKVRP